MKNLSLVTTSAFQSYDINIGEYSQTVRVDDVIDALAAAFGSNPAHVHIAFRQICIYGEVFAGALCPSEEKVLFDLYEFAKGTYVPKSGSWGQSTRVFTYCNLNTGRTVQWIDFRV